MFKILGLILTSLALGYSSLDTSTVFHRDDCTSIAGKDPNRIDQGTYDHFLDIGKKACLICKPTPETVVDEPVQITVPCQLQRWQLTTWRVTDPISKDGDIVMLSAKGIPAFNKAYYDKRLQVLEWLVTPLEFGMYYPQTDCIMHEIKVKDSTPSIKQMCGLLQAGLKADKLTHGGYMIKFAEYANRYNKLLSLEPPAKVKPVTPTDAEALEMLKGLIK